MELCGIHIGGTSHKLPMNLIHNMGSEITFLDYYRVPPGANELSDWHL